MDKPNLYNFIQQGGGVINLNTINIDKSTTKLMLEKKVLFKRKLTQKFRPKQGMLKRVRNQT